MDRIIKILKEIRPEFDFENSSDYIKNGMLDSLDIIILVLVLEETYSISIDGSDIIPENFNDLDAIKKLVEGTVQKYESEI